MESNKKGITEEQHFVPKFYLKKFINGNNEIEIFNCKERKLLLPRGPDGLCYENFFYGITTGKEDDVSQLIEEYFCALEDGISKKFDTITKKILDFEIIQESEKWIISLLMSMLWIRGPIMRKQVNRMAEESIKHITKFIFSTKPEIFDEIERKVNFDNVSEDTRKKCRDMILNDDYAVEINNQPHMMMFDEIHKFANLFYAKDWVIYISKSRKKFITSDNPIAEIFPKKRSLYGNTFFDRTHYFSLTPEVLILARKPTNQEGDKIHRKTLFDCNNEKILSLNFTVGSKTYKYAFSAKKESFEDILLILAQLEGVLKE